MVIKNRIIMKVFYYIICAACFAGCVSSSNDKTVKENGRTLHNGIVLPEQWPPSMIDDGVRCEMSLPYISNKPTVISVNLGRQLFVDDFLIAETDIDDTISEEIGKLNKTREKKYSITKLSFYERTEHNG